MATYCLDKEKRKKKRTKGENDYNAILIKDIKY